MKSLRRFWHRLIGTFSRWRSDDELAAELETHRQLLIDEYERRGMPPEHARRAAALKLGSVTTTADQYRDTRGLPSVDGVLQDLRVSIRGLRARPAFTLTCVLTLALAIGANVAIFSLIDRVVLHPLDVPDPSELVRLTLQGEVRGVPQQGTSMPWDMAQAFLGVPSLDNAALTSDASERAGRGLELAHGRAEAFLIDVRYVTANYFGVLGLRPAPGRDFVSSDDTPGALPVTVLAHRVWRTRFGADPSIVGRAIAINGIPVVVIGVAPRSFTDIELGVDPPDLYLPLRSAPLLATHLSTQTSGREFAMLRDAAASRGMTLSPISPVSMVTVIGRVRTDSIGRVQSEVAATFQQYIARRGAAPARSGSSMTAAVVPLTETMLPFSSRAEIRQFLWLLGGAVALTLLIGCANLAGLLVARAEERRPELAVRAALGAGRVRLIRVIAIEAALLAGAGGMLALAVARWLAQALSAFVLPGNVMVAALRDWMGPRTAAFAIAATAMAALLICMMPAARAAGKRLALESERSRGGSPRLAAARVLVAVQVTIAVILVFSAILFVRTLSNALATELGFEGHGLLSASVGVPSTGQFSLGSVTALDMLAERARSLPGVVGATVGPLPLVRGSDRTDSNLVIDGVPSDGGTVVDVVYVAPDYFATLRQPIVRGREFHASDRPDAEHVAIANQAAVQRFWPSQDALGRQLAFARRGGTQGEAFTVVGVAANVKLKTLLEADRPVVYLARQQHPSYLEGLIDASGQSFLILRANAPPGAVTQLLAREAADLRTPIQSVVPLEERIAELLMPQRFGRMLLTLLGAVALLLTIAGIYGLVACLVARNTREIGIRMTLGAGRQEILSSLVESAVVPIACGVLAGSIVAWYGGRFADRFMYGMSGSDPATLALAAAAIVGAAVFAALLPARRALGIDPVAALRAE